MSWLIAAHRGPTVAMVALATLISGLIDGPVLMTAVAVLAGQLSVGWQNDWIDLARDIKVGRSSKPLVNGAITRPALGWAWVLAGIAAVALSLVGFGAAGGAAHIGAIASAYTYNLGLKKTLLSPLPYISAFALFPVALFWAASRPVPVWLVGVGALAGLIIHVLNVWPDIDEDLATGVHGLPQRLVAFAREASTTDDRRTQRLTFGWLRRWK